jgi:putative phage-type endonuclease
VTAVELLAPGDATHNNERWYELRRQGITASEIAAVLGISRWESPFSLYWRKANDWRSDDNQFTSAGRHLEDAIADWWMASQDPLENMQMARAGLYAHPERPWQLATPDRLLHPTCACCADGMCSCGLYGNCADCRNTGLGGPTYALLECKWVAYSWDGWGEPGTSDIPVYYRAQCLWQLDVLGVDEVHVAALGPGGFRAYRVERDEADLEVMRKAGAEFHRRLTEGDPPDLDSHSATLDALKRLYPGVGEGDVEVPRDLAILYRCARDDRKTAEERIALHEAQIRTALGETYARAVHDGQTVASRSVFEQHRIDTKRLRAEHPDIAAEFTTTTTVDRLNPGRSRDDA